MAKICEHCKKWPISPLSDKYCSECRFHLSQITKPQKIEKGSVHGIDHYLEEEEDW